MIWLVFMSLLETPFTTGKISEMPDMYTNLIYPSPERLSPRYEQDEAERQASGFTNSTYKTVFDRFDHEGSEV